MVLAFCLNFEEKYSGMVMALYCLASRRNFRARTIQAVLIPRRHPAHVQIPESPVE